MLDDPLGPPINGGENWQSGILPPIFQGARFRSTGSLNGRIWDNHTSLSTTMKAACDRTDRPIAALMRDLKRRGLLESTLVAGGEFGRLPIAQLPSDRDDRKAGRDYNKNAFCTWMAGAGKGSPSNVDYGIGDESHMHYVTVDKRLSRIPLNAKGYHIPWAR